LDVIQPLLIFAFLGTCVLLLAVRSVPPEERPWIRKTLIIAFTVRVMIAVFFEVFRDWRIFHEDSEGYEAIAVALSRSWWGSGPPLAMADTNSGFYYLGGGICFLFGPFKLNLPLFNSLVGTTTSFLIYRATRRFVHVRVARMACALVAFAPSMVMWSAIALKDAVTTFLIVLTLVSCMELKAKFTLQSLVGTILPILAIQPIRFYLVYFMLFAVLGSLLVDRGLSALTGVYKQLFLLGALVGVFVLTGVSGRTMQESEQLTFEKVSAYREGMATSARSGFAQNVDISTPGKAMAFLPIGMANLLLGPFPWQMSSIRAVIALPETAIWWFLVPATVRGAVFLARRRLSEISPVLLFAITLSCAYSLMHGNIGSGFRQRSQIFVLFFIFSAVGWYQRRCRNAGISEEHLLRSTEAAAAA
jgi:4-amino-4-deoxy-L-arabinose transferase-like glycosyltransferase